ncbi:hypothetical protein PV326_012559 [Microctonus aethiopoides]|nr:hypothetical protein PV326_012559 [Microctonus aethiopoides]
MAFIVLIDIVPLLIMMLSAIIIVSFIERNGNINNGNGTESEERQTNEIAGTTTTGADGLFLQSPWCPLDCFYCGSCEDCGDCGGCGDCCASTCLGCFEVCASIDLCA